MIFSWFKSHKAMEKIFGPNYNNRILSLTFMSDTEYAINRNTYMRFKINNLQDFEKPDNFAFDAKHKIEALPGFEDLKVHAFVVMGTEYYPRWSRIAYYPIYKERSRNIIGTIVFKDKKTGKIIPATPVWRGVYNFNKPKHAARKGLRYFIKSTGNANFYKKLTKEKELIEMLKKEKQK